MVATKAKYRNRRLEVLHKTAAALHAVGALDKNTMRNIDAFCLTKAEAACCVASKAAPQQL